jgi:hypothetical protein
MKRSGKPVPENSDTLIETDSGLLPVFFVIPAVVIAVPADIFRCRILLVFRAAAITELAPAVFSRGAVLMYFGHINRADLYMRHTGKKVPAYYIKSGATQHSGLSGWRLRLKKKTKKTGTWSTSFTQRES